MTKLSAAFAILSVGLFAMLLPIGCDGVPLGDLGDLLNVNLNVGGGGNENDNSSGGATGAVEFDVVASNTGGATGIALRLDGALFAVNSTGLYGPITEGDDLSTMDPIGATNLADPELFDTITSTLVLAITNSGEFWIGSTCCQVMAVVAPEGGDAEAYLGLQALDITSTVKAETMLIVPEGFEGSQMVPGLLLAGLETTFSWLVGIDVDGDATAMDIDNPDALNRNAHHLTFGLDGTLYSSKGVSALTSAGFQTIDPDGTPHTIEGTVTLSAESFVVLESGDFVIRGTHQTGPTTVEAGIVLYGAADETITFALEIPTEERSEDDEMIITPNGSAIYLSLPLRNEIVMVRILE